MEAVEKPAQRGLDVAGDAITHARHERGAIAFRNGSQTRASDEEWAGIRLATVAADHRRDDRDLVLRKTDTALCLAADDAGNAVDKSGIGVDEAKVGRGVAGRLKHE